MRKNKTYSIHNCASKQRPLYCSLSLKYCCSAGVSWSNSTASDVIKLRFFPATAKDLAGHKIGEAHHFLQPRSDNVLIPLQANMEFVKSISKKKHSVKESSRMLACLILSVEQRTGDP